MGSKRRYKIADEPVYSNVFDNERLASPILNASNRDGGNLRYFGNYHNEQFLRGLLAELQGDEDGNLRDLYGEKIPARLKHIREKQKAVNNRWEYLQQSAVNKGRHRPKQMPQTLVDQLRSLEAQEDVVREEIEYLEQLLSEATRSEREFEHSTVLKHMSVNRMREGVIAEVAGQRVELVDRVPVIVDKRSPYNGMSVADFHKYVSGPWSKARNRIENERRKLEKDLHARGLREEFPQHWAKKHAELKEKHPEWEKLFSLKLKKRPGLPEWPEGVKNYLKTAEAAR